MHPVHPVGVPIPRLQVPTCSTLLKIVLLAGSILGLAVSAICCSWLLFGVSITVLTGLIITNCVSRSFTPSRFLSSRSRGSPIWVNPAATFPAAGWGRLSSMPSPIPRGRVVPPPLPSVTTTPLARSFPAGRHHVGGAPSPIRYPDVRHRVGD